VGEKPLGSVQLRTKSGEIILVPKPSKDPNDPLNWCVSSQKPSSTKKLIPQVTTLQILCCSRDLLRHAHVHFPSCWSYCRHRPNRHGLRRSQCKSFRCDCSSIILLHYLALTQGTGNLLWQPLINKYGKRPMYIISFTGYLLAAVWSGMSTGYGSELTARILLGFFSGAGKCLGPATISDVFFIHELRSVMA